MLHYPLYSPQLYKVTKRIIIFSPRTTHQNSNHRSSFTDYNATVKSIIMWYMDGVGGVAIDAMAFQLNLPSSRMLSCSPVVIRNVYVLRFELSPIQKRKKLWNFNSRLLLYTKSEIYDKKWLREDNITQPFFYCIIWHVLAIEVKC